MKNYESKNQKNEKREVEYRIGRLTWPLWRLADKLIVSQAAMKESSLDSDQLHLFHDQQETLIYTK
ncbi:MAG: hypothetical protein D3925_09675 [Candidatus Electrothrix sp. AR5]|nr:hypothetical protein [Candidatus Electrothrix sp. AR5]